MLKGLTLGAGATLLDPLISCVQANAAGKTSAPRFVFVVQGNGFDGIQVGPKSIPFRSCKDRDKLETFRLRDHKLPRGMEAFEKMRDRLTVIQSLSGRCTGGCHSIHGRALGLYRTSDASRSPHNVTIDYKLGVANPGILPWVGVGMFPGCRGKYLSRLLNAGDSCTSRIRNIAISGGSSFANLSQSIQLHRNVSVEVSPRLDFGVSPN